MRKVITILVLLISVQVYGQKNQFKNLMEISSKIASLQRENSNLKENFIILIKRIEKQDSIIKNINVNTIETKSKVDIYQSALDSDDKIFSGLSTYFTIISILLSIIVIAIPVINYFLVLQPNKGSTKKLETLEKTVLDKIENNFDSYFENLKKKKNQKMINLLDDRSRLSEVTGYFFLGDYEELSQKEVERVIKFLEENSDIESTDKIVLNSLVINSEYLIAEKYYKSIFDKEEKSNYEYAIEYLVENDFASHIDYVAKIIKADDDGHALLISFFDYIQKKFIGNWFDKKRPEKMEKGEKYAKLLFDNQKIIDAIKDKKIPIDMLGHEPKININRLNMNPYLRDTKYYDIYLKEMDNKYKKQ